MDCILTGSESCGECKGEKTLTSYTYFPSWVALVLRAVYNYRRENREYPAPGGMLDQTAQFISICDLLSIIEKRAEEVSQQTGATLKELAAGA